MNRRCLGLSAFVVFLCVLSLSSSAQVAGQNINMVSGTQPIGGDPYLQRQNEPSMAVSTRNPQHLLAGANDYRTVDIPFPPDQGKETGDAWVSIFTSLDGGQSWSSTLLPGFPQDTSGVGPASTLHNYTTATDPTVRAGTHGLFYYSGLVFNRGTNSPSGVFVATIQDQNNKGNGAGAIQRQKNGTGSPFLYLNVNLVDTGTSGQFLDKPWIAVDVPRPGRTATCNINGKTILSGYVYVFYTQFTGSSVNPSSKIKVVTSTNCGASWSHPTSLAQSIKLSQGTVASIDPGTGTVYVFWRQIDRINQPDAIQYAYSTNGGSTFSNGTAYTFPAFTAFDEDVNGATFRETDLPAAAVDGSGRVWLAFSQRNMGPLGASRIMITTLARGSQTWTKPYIADPTAANVPGHQLMPSLSFAYGKILLAFLDNREDNTKGILTCPTGSVCAKTSDLVEQRVPIQGSDLDGANPNYAKVFSATISDAGMKIRHTIDVRGALIDPAKFSTGTNLLFPSVRISQYKYGSRPGSRQIEQMQFNPPNFPMFAQGTKPFIGDYIDTAALTMLPGPNNTWLFNTQPSNAAVFHTTWTDNRDVRPPPVVCNNGVCTQNWQLYTPVGFSSPGTSGYDPTQTRPACVPGQAGSRNQNVYASRITQGLMVGIKENTKPLTDSTKNNAPIQRAFSVFARNTTNQQTFYRFSVIPLNPPGASLCQTDNSGTTASFTQFNCANFVDVIALPRTTVSRTVFVTSSLKFPSISVNVAQITGIGGTPINGGLQSTTAINPDSTNPDITNPDITNPDITNPDITNPDITNPDITNSEVYNPTVTNPDITNPDITNPDITNPDITNPDITNPDITNPDIVNVQVTNPDITNPDITNPDITNPDITNPDITNPDITNPADGGGITDFTFKLSNKGNTSSSYTAKQFAKAIGSLCDTRKCQLIARKTYPTPVASACDLKVELQNQSIASIPNPALSTSPGVPDNGSDTQGVQPDATISLGPGEAGRVTMRVFGIMTTSLPDQPVKTVAVAGGANTGTNTPAASLTITTIALPVAVVGTNYNNGAGFMATFVGGVAPVSFITQSTLPTNITLNPAGLFSGPVTSAPGAFPVALQAADAPTGILNGQVVPRQQSFDLTNLTLNVNKFTVTGITAQNTDNGGIYLSGNPGDSITVKATVSNIGPAAASNVTASVLAFTAIPGGGGPTPVLTCSPASPSGVLIASNSSQEFLYTCTTSGGNGFVNQFSATANATYINGPTSVPASSSFSTDPSVQITVDTAKPTIATVTATAGNPSTPYAPGTWTSQNVTVTFTCSDNFSGPGAVYPVINGLPAGVIAVVTQLDPLTSMAAATLTAETSGTTLTGSCIDNASNAVSAPTAFGPIMIDKTPPVLSVGATAGQAPYIAGTWSNQDVTVTYSCVDNTSAANANSGVAPGSPTGSQTFTQETTAAGVNSSGSCTDNAGNVSMNAPLAFGPILIDKTPPVVTGSATAGPNNAPYIAGTWTAQSPVTVSFSCSDTLSGPKPGSTTGNTALAGPTQNTNIQGSCMDIAGNTGNGSFGPVKIDQITPVIIITSPAPAQTFLLNSQITPAFTCNDAGGGDLVDCLANPSANSYTATPIGPGTFTVNAVDESGNPATASTNYLVIYGFTGFQAPLASAGTTAAPSNSGNIPLGSAVPIAWTLADGSVPPVAITDVSTLTSIVAIPNQACTGSVPGPGITLYPIPQGLNSTFTYDPARGAFVFNWDTSGLNGASGCYNIVISLNDTTQYATIVKLVTALFTGQAIDPVDAGVANGDLVSGTVTTLSDGTVTLSVRFAPATFNSSTTEAEFLLDTDQNPATGSAGSDAGCAGDATTLGTDYLVIAQSGFGVNTAAIYQATGGCNNFAFLGTAPVTILVDGMDVSFPLSLLTNTASSNTSGIATSGPWNFKVTSDFSTGGNTFSGIVDVMPDVGLNPVATVPQ